MPDAPKTFYLTTPIYYVNARPHIGHAYSTIVADVLARRHRLLGDDTYFLTGTDEHGQKIERAAAAAGIPPQQYADQVSKTFSDLWARMGITHDQFIRTTDPNHKRGVQKLFADLYEKGQIYLSSYTGQYSVGEEMFVEGPPGTIGPDGRPTETVTEENFFFRLSDYQVPLLNLIESNELVITPDSSRNEVLAFLRGHTSLVEISSTSGLAPASSTSGLAPASSTSGLAPASSTSGLAPASSTSGLAPASSTSGLAAGFSPRETSPEKEGALAPGLATSAAGIPFVPGSLRDLSVSRSSFTWGIPVPEAIQTAAGAKEKHVIYVWLDALANYMTALGYGSPDDTLWQKYWPADIHLVGKEITRFHCVYWPAFLLALNPKLQHEPNAPIPILTPEEHAEWAKKWQPKQVTANGWLLFDNSKMSKSKGNVVRTETILDAFGTLCPPNPNNASHSRISSGLQPTETRSDEDGALAPESQPTPHDRDLFAADILRYYLLREIPFGQDGSFSFDSLITRYNADLANGYGNLVSRTLSMINLYLNGQASSQALADYDRMIMVRREGQDPLTISIGTGQIAAEMLAYHEGEAEKKDERIHRSLIARKNIVTAISDALSEAEFEKALEHTTAFIQVIDEYLTSKAPWKLSKSENPEDRKVLEDTLYVAEESIRQITALLYPILPYATARVWAQLGLGDIEAAARNGDLKNLQWGGLKPGTKLGPLSPIFPRADKGLAQIMTDMENPTPTPELSSRPERSAAERPAGAAASRPEAPLKSALTPATPAPVPTSTFDPAAGPRTASLSEPGPLTVGGSAAHTTHNGPTPSHTEAQASGIFATPPTAPPSTEITIDDFAKIELRVAQILVAERIPKADKLLRLEVDLGPLGTRQILSGIAEHYAPEDLLHRKIVVITNLAPRKMRGLESHGMLLAASEGDHGKPILATFAEDIPNGTRLK